jgi:hypothetical protein
MAMVGGFVGREMEAGLDEAWIRIAIVVLGKSIL